MFFLCFADEKVPKHNIFALRLAVVDKMRSLGFTKLAKEQLGYVVSEDEFAECEENESLAEIWEYNVFNAWVLACRKVQLFVNWSFRMQFQHLLAVLCGNAGRVCVCVTNIPTLLRPLLLRAVHRYFCQQ